ncbi:UNVERIFIED_CONTAM: hypothetical protein K2H54_014620 [Gekko kuhli]
MVLYFFFFLNEASHLFQGSFYPTALPPKHYVLQKKPLYLAVHRLLPERMETTTKNGVTNITRRVHHQPGKSPFTQKNTTLGTSQKKTPPFVSYWHESCE